MATTENSTKIFSYTKKFLETNKFSNRPTKNGSFQTLKFFQKFLVVCGLPGGAFVTKIFRIMGEYVTKILKCFGCIEGDEPIGFPSANQSGAVNKDEVVAPYLQVMARFRADIRNGMKGDKSDLAKAVSPYL